MSRSSAGILVYRRRSNKIEVLLVHPGGPFWANKDIHAWSIPKGEFEEAENSFTTAAREFEEETGQPPPQNDPVDLGSVKSSSKTIYIWAIEGDLDASQIKSNTFKMEWPPKSGKMEEFPEVDKAKWFDINTAMGKLHKGQGEFMLRLSEKLGVQATENSEESLSSQQSLF